MNLDVKSRLNHEPRCEAKGEPRDVKLTLNPGVSLRLNQQDVKLMPNPGVSPKLETDDKVEDEGMHELNASTIRS